MQTERFITTNNDSESSDKSSNKSQSSDRDDTHRWHGWDRAAKLQKNLSYLPTYPFC